MILHFHDYILAKQPWAYCHLDDSSESIVYLDQTSKQNHLYPRKNESDEYIRSADNQIAIQKNRQSRSQIYSNSKQSSN